MNLYCVVFGLVFLAVGIAFFFGAASHWIKGWREMPKEERDKIRMDKLRKNIGGVFWTAGIIFLVSGFSVSFFNAAFTWCILIWFVLTGIDIAFITKSKRYRSK